jgi:hypothetical protein
VTVRKVGRARRIPLGEIAGIRSGARVAHQLVLDTREGPVTLPVTVTSDGFLRTDERSEQIRRMIAAALEGGR